jgi:hypothetical protein
MRNSAQTEQISDENRQRALKARNEANVLAMRKHGIRRIDPSPTD